jgi:hypothetical protein
MSGGFHVHGPHDHAVEHAAHKHAAHGDDGFSGRIAVVTAVLATVGAMFAYQGGSTQANAMLYKNNAAIKKTEAANKWGLYQSKSGKQNLAEVAQELVSNPAKQAAYALDVQRYDSEKKVIKGEADALEATALDFEKQSDEELHKHHRWAQATTVLQIAIALSAIALITRRKWLAYGVYGVSVAGVVLGVMAFLHI